MANVSLTLVRSYRGYKAGETISVTPQLAARLKSMGVGKPEESRPLLDRHAVERAVSTPSIETRDIR